MIDASIRQVVQLVVLVLARDPGPDTLNRAGCSGCRVLGLNNPRGRAGRGFLLTGDNVRLVVFVFARDAPPVRHHHCCGPGPVREQSERAIDTHTHTHARAFVIEVTQRSKARARYETWSAKQTTGVAWATPFGCFPT